MNNLKFIILILCCFLYLPSARAQSDGEFKKNFLGIYGGVALTSGAYTKDPDYFKTGYQFSIGYRRSPNKLFSYTVLLRYISTPRNKDKVEDFYGFSSVSVYQSERLNRYEFHAGPVLSFPIKSWSIDFRLNGAADYAVYPRLQVIGIADSLRSVSIESGNKLTLGYSANFWLRHNFKGNFSYGFGLDYSAVKATFADIQKQFEYDNGNVVTSSEDIVLHMNAFTILLSMGFRF